MNRPTPSAVAAVVLALAPASRKSSGTRDATRPPVATLIPMKRKPATSDITARGSVMDNLEEIEKRTPSTATSAAHHTTNRCEANFQR